MMARRPGFNPRLSHTKDSKTVLDASLLNTQHYKVRIKGKVKQSTERSSAPLHLDVVVIVKGAFGSPLTSRLLYLLTSSHDRYNWKIILLIETTLARTNQI